MPINKALKSSVQKIKNDLNLKQVDVAMKLGVTNSYLSDMVNGRVPLTDQILNKLFEVFQVRVESDIRPANYCERCEQKDKMIMELWQKLQEKDKEISLLKCKQSS